MNNPPNTPPSAEELEAVKAQLRVRHNTKAGLSNFELSIATQLVMKGTLTRKQVDAILRERDRPSFPGADKVPAGNYAVQVDGEWVCVKVWRGSRDSSYVRTYELHSATEQGEELPTAVMLSLIVAAGPFEAAKAYGLKTRRCSICTKRLSNALSRKLRIGPVCLTRFVEDPTERMILKIEAESWLEGQGFDPRADLPAGVDLEALEAVA